MAAAFIVSFLTRTFFSEQQLMLDNSLTTSVYGTLGTTYAVLIAFVVSGVWQLQRRRPRGQKRGQRTD